MSDMNEPSKRQQSLFYVKNQELWRVVFAGVSNMTAASVTNPIDVIKIRMQLDGELKAKSAMKVFSDRSYKGIFRGIVKIVKDEGVSGLYKGLTASLMREGTYSSIRLGTYEPIKTVVFGATDPAYTPLWKKIGAGAITGSIGSAIATPTDLIKVRQQAEGVHQVARYSSTMSAFAVVYRQGGVRALYVGMGPTVQRAAILTATQIPTYDHTKHTLLNHNLMQEGPRLHVVSSMAAGFMAALTTSPVDLIKTRVMNQNQKDVYRHAWHCVVQTMKTEGPLGFYKGFFPNWLRIGPHTIVTFFIFEQLRKVVGIAPV